MPEEKILTLHPRGKGGKNISVEKYYILKRAILKLTDKKQLTQLA